MSQLMQNSDNSTGTKSLATPCTALAACKKKCRCCLVEAPELTSLLVDNTSSAIYCELTSSEVSEDVSWLICAACMNQLRNFSQFKTMCLESLRSLREEAQNASANVIDELFATINAPLSAAVEDQQKKPIEPHPEPPKKFNRTLEEGEIIDTTVEILDEGVEMVPKTPVPIPIIEISDVTVSRRRNRSHKKRRENKLLQKNLFKRDLTIQTRLRQKMKSLIPKLTPVRLKATVPNPIKLSRKKRRSLTRRKSVNQVICLDSDESEEDENESMGFFEDRNKDTAAVTPIPLYNSKKAKPLRAFNAANDDSVEIVESANKSANRSYLWTRRTPKLKKKIGSGTKKRTIVIDGSNVAISYTNTKMFSSEGLEIAIKYFEDLNHPVKAIVPQFRLKRSQSTNPDLLERLRKKGKVLLTPCKNMAGKTAASYDDRFILEVAEKLDAAVVSNDNFNDLMSEKPEWERIIKTRVIGFMWCENNLLIPNDPYGKDGPMLDEILGEKKK